MEGLVPTTRLDFLIGAVAFLTRALVLAKGVDAETIDKIVEEGSANLVEKAPETPAEAKRRRDETMRGFFDFLRLNFSEGNEK